MPRIEIELTSARPDGTWTWRAAGARQPKGMLDGSVLPGGVKVGDVLRAEADVDIDGITVRSAQTVTQKKAEPERIEIIGTGREEPPVTTNMRGGVEAGGERGRRGDRDHDRGKDRDRPGRGPGRPGGPGGPGGPRFEQSRGPDGAGGPRPPDRGDRARRDSRPSEAGRPPHDRPAGDRAVGDRAPGGRSPGGRPAGDRPAGARSSGDRGPGDRGPGDRGPGDRGPGDRGPGDRPSGGPPPGDRPSGDRPAGDRPPGDRRPGGDRPMSSRPAGDRPTSGRPSGDRSRPGERQSGERGERPSRGAPRAAEAPRPKARRLQPGRTYRDAVLAELSPERKAVAEQILRGGIPAVRQAVEEQNAQAREVGGPEIKVDALLAVAEELLPALRAAEWRDRAEAAVVIVDEISVRDLRAVVSGADTARDEEGRALAGRLREALDQRSAAERQSWVDEIMSSLDDGRIVRALRISGRPPEPGMRFPTELAQRLSEAAGEALTPDTAPDRWAAVLEAVLASPVRRTIAPKGLPAEPGEALTKALRQAGPRVPAVAALLGEPPGAPPRRPPRPPGPRVVSDPTRPPGWPATPPPGRPGTPPPPRPPAADVVAPAPTEAAPMAPAADSAPAPAESEPATAPAGPAPDGPAPDGPAPDGPAPDGPAPDGPAPDGGAADHRIEAESAAERGPDPEADVEVAAAPGEAESSSAPLEKDGASSPSSPPAEELGGPASLDLAASMPPGVEAPNGVADLSSGRAPDTELPTLVEEG